MIETFVHDYKRSDRDIAALTYVLILLLTLILGRVCQLIYQHQYHALWDLLTQAVPLLSVLVVVRVANRLISSGNIIREDDRRQDIVRTTHHLIAIAKDLKAKVEFVKSVLTEGGRPPIAIVQVAKSIEDRYETLLQRDGYKYLPGPCVDIITRISGDIFGIALMAEGMTQCIRDNPASALMPLSVDGNRPPPPHLEELLKELNSLIDHLFEVRLSIQAEKNSA